MSCFLIDGQPLTRLTSLFLTKDTLVGNQPCKKMKQSGLRLLRIKTKNEHTFTNKALKIDDKSNFVMLSGVVKTLFRTDNKGEITERLWKRLEPNIDKTEHKRINDQVFISAKALVKLVDQNGDACPKTWGVFRKDGLTSVLNQMGHKGPADESESSESEDSSDEDDEIERTPSSKKRKHQGIIVPQNDRNKKGGTPARVGLLSPNSTDEGQDTLTALNEILIDKREEVLAEREEALDKRESILHNRERKCRMGELMLKQEAARLQTLEKELKKRESSVSQKDMNAFFDKISSLTNQFKNKVSRSRGGSPVRGRHDKRANSSPTPSGSDNNMEQQAAAGTSGKDNIAEENATAQTLALMKAPSPIPSGSPSPADSSPIEL